jgi:hypothetical protein
LALLGAVLPAAAGEGEGEDYDGEDGGTQATQAFLLFRTVFDFSKHARHCGEVEDVLRLDEFSFS